MEEILNILDKEKGNVSRAKIAQMLGMEEKEVADKIEKMEKENVIVGYKTIVNWDKTDKDNPTGNKSPFRRFIRLIPAGVQFVT